MNDPRNNYQAPGADQSALSLLVNAADSHDPPRGGQRETANRGSIAEALRFRGFSGADSASLEEQLFLAQQQAQQASYGAHSNHPLLSQLRDQNHHLLSQLGGGGQQHQLAALLGLSAPAPGPDIRALAARLGLQQQASQLSPADILSLSRTPGGLASLSGLSGLLGNNFSSNGMSATASPAAQHQLDYESFQRLEELKRRGQLLSSSAGAGNVGASGMRAPGGGEAAVKSPPTRPKEASTQHASVPPPAPMETTSKPKATEAAAFAPQATDSGKDELEKAPGSVIVPCRARGMPMDHNFKTAYFVIPENVKHGEELICSYFACRNAGIKFRYCSHCKVPVAKRNFRKRHKHGGEDVGRGGDDSGAEDETPVHKGIPSQIVATNRDAQDQAEADGLSSQSDESVPHHAKHAAEVAAMQKGLVQSSMRTFENKKSSVSATEQPRDGMISQERRDRWVTLLAKRPATKDGDSMSAWLMEVLAVSDLDTPLKISEVAEPPKETENMDPHKKHSAIELTKSDNDYGSSNEDSHAIENNDRADDEKPAAGDSNGAIIKKKRPADFLTEDSEAKPSEAFVSGSFAEWKERKRQKKQSKMMSPTQSESV